ncbi:MAG: ATP-dependent DNA ligase [Candidatus Dormibacteria bacterium]
MLASEAPEQVNFPVYASSKLDGIRGIALGGVLWSRSGKPIPNKYVQTWAKANANLLEGLDGELIVGKPWAKDVYRATNSAVMSHDGEPSFEFYVFDHVLNNNATYTTRIKELGARKMPPKVVVLNNRYISSQEELDEFENACLDQGYEGLILRDPNGPYKNGRSTTKQGWMLKLKRFSDDEATIIGSEELMSNQNTANKDAFGRTERSSHLANMVPAGLLGALVVVDCKTKVEFNIGTGFDAETRERLWKQRDALVGKLVRYRHFRVGVKDKPRFPVFSGFRDPRDLS